MESLSPNLSIYDLIIDGVTSSSKLLIAPSSYILALN
nr:MAG TPA: hypothetical protein [Crassvirales sp.]